MRRYRIAIAHLIALALSMTASAPAQAQSPPDATTKPTTQAAPSGTTPPGSSLRGRQALGDDEIAPVDGPTGELLDKGGGRRGEGDPDLVLAAVAPVDVARTRFEQPALFYHVSKPTSHRIVIAVSKEGAPDREALLELPGAQRAGFHKVDLAAMNVTLESGTIYEWVVAIVEDEKYRSKDVVVTGFIQRIDVSADQQAAILATTTLEQRKRALDEAGLTQDALSMLVSVDRRLAGEATGAAFHRDLLNVLQLTETSPSETRSLKQ